MTSHLTVNSQVIYVDCINGNNNNPGTKAAPVFSIDKASEIIKSTASEAYIIKLNPGIYILEKHVTVETDKDMKGKRVVIEASFLPGDTSWTPEKMPVITCKALKGEIPGNPNSVVSFLIEESHVTIRGLKFHGYFYPHVRYFPVARLNREKTDLLVEQCMFVGDANISQIQAGVIAHGNEVMIDHCIFYRIRNTVVFFLDSGSGIKHGNGITNSIIFGASQAVWTVSPDSGFKFQNNIVSNCRYVFVKYDSNKTIYSLDNCVIVDNQFYTGVPGNGYLSPEEFELKENNLTKEGEISLLLTGANDKPALDEVDKPLPADYMHPLPGSPGYELNAGLFKKRK